MKKKWIAVLAIPALVIFMVIGGEVVMHLWNWLAPALFGWRVVSFWQALGLLVLCRILFGGFGGHGHNRSNWSQRNAGRWERMTPEEREKFRQGVRSGCGGFAAPSGEAEKPA